MTSFAPCCPEKNRNQRLIVIIDQKEQRWDSSYHSSFSVSQIKDYITDKGNSVFVIRAEGGVQDEGGSQMGTYIVTNENSSIGLSLFANIDLANEDLSHQKIVVFLGNYTGAGGPNAYNLPHAAVDCGAATAIGFKDQIDNEAFKNWIVGFSDLMKQGNTLAVLR